jgi:polysaccharide pyruvyl transferase WcaK-like protein
VGSVVLLAPVGPPDPGRRGLVEAATHGLAGCSLVVRSRWDAVRPGTAVVVVGGTPLGAEGTGYPNPELRRVSRLARWARLSGGLVVLLGVGALPPARPDAGRRMARLADTADLVVLRDEASAAALRTAGASPPFRVGADPTWTLLDRHPGAREKAGEPAGALVVPDHGGARARHLVALLAAVLAPRGGAPRLLPWGPGAGGLVDARDRMAGAELVVAFRFHGVVAAAAAGTPCVAVGSEPGIRALAARLGQPWIPAGTDGEVVGQVVDEARGRGPAPPSAVKAEVARAEEGFRLARLLLTKGEGEEAETLVGLPLGARPWV